MDCIIGIKVTTKDSTSKNIDFIMDILINAIPSIDSKYIGSFDSIDIIVKRDHSTFSQKNYEHITQFYETQYGMDQILEKYLPQLIEHMDKHKLISNYPNRYYIREQYSGSCTHNGILLAIYQSGSWLRSSIYRDMASQKKTDVDDLKSLTEQLKKMQDHT